MSDGRDVGAFIPTTFIWDVSEIERTDVSSDRFKELLVRLYQNINLIQATLNIKDSALYDTEEFVSGQTFFPGPDAGSNSGDASNRRQVYRKVIDFGALPNSATKSVAHEIDITSGYSFTRLYGAASDQSGLNFLAIPNSSITLSVDATNVNITTAAALSAYAITYVTLEYLKQ